MSQTSDSPTSQPPTGMLQKFLNMVEKVGNKVPHPAVIFLSLIAIVVILSALLALTGTSVSYEVLVPEKSKTDKAAAPELDYDSGTIVTYTTENEKKYKIEKATVAVRSLISIDGIRFMYSSLIPSFMGFTAVGLLIVAMVGAGVAEEAGLVKALIR